MTTKLTGKHTDAEIMLDEENLDEEIINQVQQLIDYEAFTESVRVMPDCHVGKGSVIGFTMPLNNKVVPNVVGTDPGCGMTALKLGDSLPIKNKKLDKQVRDQIPMGWGKEGVMAPKRDFYSVETRFPWDEATEILRKFIEEQEGEWLPPMREFYENGGYDLKYFKELVSKRAEQMGKHFDMDTAKDSIGTLGSGNHFIEIGQSNQTGEYWVVVHSGSRGLGSNTAKYWQQRATNLRHTEHTRNTLQSLPEEYLTYTKFDLKEISDEELLDWVRGNKDGSFVDYNALRNDFANTNPERIGEIGNKLKEAVPEGDANGDPLDHLEGSEAAGYLIDMIMCQKYASESRKMIAHKVADTLGVTPTDMIESPHNVISFRDGIIRKGATESYTGERIIIPLNMRDGILLAEGKSNPNWNHSVAHGAGRIMSRHQAEDEFTEKQLQKEMEQNGAFATRFPTDESPGAYKNAELIENAIEPTATIIDRLEVVHSFKADD